MFVMAAFLAFAYLVLNLTLHIAPAFQAVHGNDALARAASLPHPLRQTTPALVSAGSGVLPLGGISVTLAVSVSNVVDLGAVTAEIGYDNAVLAPVQCRLNHTAFPAWGHCNLTYDSNGDGAPDSVRFNLLTDLWSGLSVPANAPVMMAEISWVATSTATIGMTTPLSATVSNFANSGGGTLLPFTIQNGQIVFAVAPSPTATPLPTATPVDTPIPTPLTTPETTPTTAPPTPTGAGDATALYLPVVASP